MQTIRSSNFINFSPSYQLTRDIGSQYEYSNLGGGLLGHVLARRAGTDYETLARSRICDPLGMKDTRITLTPEMKARLAVGHDQGLESVENWDLPTLAGAGALRSTANDLLKFLAANLGYTKVAAGACDGRNANCSETHGPAGIGSCAWHGTSTQ